ncbi:MAG: hypothetical protein IT173_09950 [Acidobacteria bacterium]|nr:hypothetical protein [Acidobacteriota bacterium]
MTVFFCTIVNGQIPGAAADARKNLSVKKAEQVMLRRAAAEDFILMARAQPAEISADLLLELLLSDTVLEKQRKIELVEEVFRRASDAAEPVKLVRSVGDSDTRTGYLSLAHSLNLDELSIKLRVIKLMLTLDRLKARALFQEISPLRLKSLSCQDDFEYDVALYYAVGKEIAEKSFDTAATARMEPVHFVASLIEEINAAAQVGPSLDLIASYRSKRTEFRFFLDGLTTSLQRIKSDPRSLASVLKHDRLTDKIRFSVGANDGRPNEFLKAYRRFLAKGLSGPQCADSVITITSEKTDEILSAANALFESPLTEEDVTPEKLEPAALTFHYWRSNKAAKILRGVQRLRFGEGKAELTTEEKSTQEWRQQLLKFLEEFNSWSSVDEETELDYLHQKSVTFNSLIQIIPPGTARFEVLRDFGLFLRNSDLQREEPLHWQYHAKYLLRTIKRFDGEERGKIVDLLTSTGNSAFSAYFRLDQLKQAPASPKP